MKDHEVVDAFVAHLRDHGHPGLQIEQRPDKENHESPDIDAIAGAFAIEHTSIDTLPNQRRDADWFIRAAAGLEQELPSTLPFRLKVTLEYDAVATGQNWDAIRASLKTWVLNDVPALPDGPHILENLPGIPFPLHVVKSSKRRPSGGSVFFGRFKPEDDTLPHRIREAFERKAAKLAPYHAKGKTTVLLVENGDSLMDEWKMLAAILRVYPTGWPAGIQQVWYADTSIPSEIEFHDFTPQQLG